MAAGAQSAYGLTHPTLPATEQWLGMKMRMISSICPIVSPADPVVRPGVAGSADAIGILVQAAAKVRAATASERRTADLIVETFVEEGNRLDCKPRNWSLQVTGRA